MAFIGKVHAGSDDDRQLPRPTDPDFEQEYPALLEYLGMTTYPDGTSRQTSTLTLFVEDGQFKAKLYDRDNARGLWVTADTWEGLLGVLEDVLASGKGSWRAEAGGVRSKGKGK